MKRLTLLIALFFVPHAQAQNTGALVPWTVPTFMNAAGTAPAALGFICSFSAETTTPATTYSYATSVTPNQNPIRLNAAGRPVNGSTEVSIYLSVQSYKFNLYAAGTGNTCNGTSVGALLKSVDNVYDSAQLYMLSFATQLDDKVCHASQYSGATADAKIFACINALPSTGGMVDARGLEGAQTISGDPFTGVTKPVELLLGAATYTVSVNVTVPASVTIDWMQGSVFSLGEGTGLTYTGGLNGSTSQHFSGSGTVTFSSSGKVQMVYPQWWGGVGDGITDNATAMTAAMNSISGVHGTVFFGDGTYLFTAPFAFTASNVTFECASPNTTLTYTGATRGITIGGSQSVSNSGIRNCRIATSSSAGGTVAGRGAIIVDGDTVTTTDIFLDNVSVDTIPTGGIVVANATRVSILHPRVTNVGEHGIYLSGCTTCLVDTPRVTDPHRNVVLASVAAAIKVSAGTGVVIAGADLDASTVDGGVGLLIENGTTQAVATGIHVRIRGANQAGLRIDTTGALVEGASIDAGAGFTNDIALDFRATCNSSRVSGLITIGTWLTSQVIYRSGSRGCVLAGGTIPGGPAGTYAIDASSSTGPVIQGVSILSGPYGIKVDNATSAKVINNTVLSSSVQYSFNAGSTSLKLVDPYYSDQLANLPTGAVNGSTFHCTNCKNILNDAAVAGATCVNAGSGAIARRENGAYHCN